MARYNNPFWISSFVKVESMKGISAKFGKNAGKIWTTLNTSGPLKKSMLIKNTKLSENDFHAAIGWLARENKICKEGDQYKLGETNLTNVIGENAGKIWKILNSTGEIDISYITKEANITRYDAYLALGWLAREDKIEGKNKAKSNQVRFKLK